MQRKIWAAAVVALYVGGCAGGPEDRYDEPFEGPPRPRAQLFISPSGEPFRAQGGEPYPAGAWFAKADADQDGRLSRAEFRADAERWFKTLDADGDGQVRMPEVSRWEEDMVPEVTRGAGQFAGGGGPRADRRGGGAVVSFRREGAAAYSLIN